MLASHAYRVKKGRFLSTIPAAKRSSLSVSAVRTSGLPTHIGYSIVNPGS